MKLLATAESSQCLTQQALADGGLADVIQLISRLYSAAELGCTDMLESANV